MKDRLILDNAKLAVIITRDRMSLDDEDISAISPTGYVELTGSIGICKLDDDGNLRDLTDEDLKRLWNASATLTDHNGVEHIVIILDERYDIW